VSVERLADGRSATQQVANLRRKFHGRQPDERTASGAARVVLLANSQGSGSLSYIIDGTTTSNAPAKGWDAVLFSAASGAAVA
jgi:hypothetical protein